MGEALGKLGNLSGGKQSKPAGGVAGSLACLGGVNSKGCNGDWIDTGFLADPKHLESFSEVIKNRYRL